MIQIIGLMVGAYVFTRMVTAGIREYPNDSNSTKSIIRVLSILAAIFAALCSIWLIVGPSVNQAFDNLR
jgi:hypothetical protein